MGMSKTANERANTKTFSELATEAKELTYPAGVWALPIADHVILVSGATEASVRVGADVLRRFLRKRVPSRDVITYRYGGKRVRRDGDSWFSEIKILFPASAP